MMMMISLRHFVSPFSSHDDVLSLAVSLGPAPGLASADYSTGVQVQV